MRLLWHRFHFLKKFPDELNQNLKCIEFGMNSEWIWNDAGNTKTWLEFDMNKGWSDVRWMKTKRNQIMNFGRILFKLSSQWEIFGRILGVVLTCELFKNESGKQVFTTKIHSKIIDNSNFNTYQKCQALLTFFIAMKRMMGSTVTVSCFCKKFKKSSRNFCRFNLTIFSYLDRLRIYLNKAP